MKLLKRLEGELKQLGQLKRVWLTSFNINIPFIEGQLLPAILGEDPPTDRMAFEVLQHELSEQEIDVRVFCDRRALEADQHKRTAIQIHPVEVRAFTGVAGINERSLFHPKVIYLEDVHGNAVLGAGSANLTISGWGRNQEVFDFRPVSTTRQQQQIQRFFNGLDATLKLPAERLAQGNDPHWEFVHSFEPAPFLARLGGDNPVERLTVWSPYLAEDLSALIKRLRQKLDNPQLTVTLVPDRIDGHKIRAPWSAELEALLTDGTLTFRDYPKPRQDNLEFTHAKIWLAESGKQASLAIGSWNFTHPGTSSFTDLSEAGGGINIEAGLLYRCDTKPVIAGATLTLAASDFTRDDELEDSELYVDASPPFDLTVIFDWQTSRYQINGQWYDGAPETGYRLELPGVSLGRELVWTENDRLQPQQLVVEDSAELLARHFYRVKAPNGESIRGLIIETGQRYRRAQSFETLKDLFDNLVSNSHPEGNGKLVLHPNLRSEDEPDEALPLPAAEDATQELTYFRLFYAMRQFRTRLEACTESAELVKWLRIYPGCLQELAEKVCARQETQTPAVIDWFLAQEVNATCAFARERLAGLDAAATETALTPAQWRAMTLAVPSLDNIKQSRAPKREQRKFIELLRSSCGYQEVRHD